MIKSQPKKWLEMAEWLINHVEFSIYKCGGWVTDPSSSGAPQKPCMWLVPLQWSIDNKGHSLSAASETPRLKVRDGCEGSVSSLFNHHDDKAASRVLRTSMDCRNTKKAGRVLEITSYWWGGKNRREKKESWFTWEREELLVIWLICSIDGD